MATESPFSPINMFWNSTERWWLDNTVNVLNVIELFTLTRLILCYANFTSVKKIFQLLMT